jgi:hypothetical protein
MNDFGAMHERHLANYHQHPAQVWCSNPLCPLHEDGTTITFVSEFGQGWFEPEECACGHEWVEDKPEEDNDE